MNSKKVFVLKSLNAMQRQEHWKAPAGPVVLEAFSTTSTFDIREARMNDLVPDSVQTAILH